MDKADTLIDQIAVAKAADRRERAKRPFPGKIQALVRMQKRRAAIMKLRVKTWRVWDIDPDTPSK